MGETSPVTTVVVHGAGSTGAAASALLGLGSDAVFVEDRSGDVEQVMTALDETLARQPGCTHLVGISLGAHAVARWAGSTTKPVPRLFLVLPAWIGVPAATAQATAAAGRNVAAVGITAVLGQLAHDGSHPDVTRLLQLSWPEYSDDELAHCLARASSGHGPTPAELAAIAAPVSVVGWRGDAFHPESAVHAWARHLRRPAVVMAARPEVRLLRQALATARRGGGVI
jgi:pimeloyl-ACP methyl ester carboxylesterase